MKKMLEVPLVIRCRDSISEPFYTDTSAPQGDCASANSFTYYLAKSLEVKTPEAIIHDHHHHHQSITSHEIPDELTEHNYAQPTQIQHFNIEWSMPMILASLPVTTTISADMNIMQKKILVK